MRNYMAFGFAVSIALLPQAAIAEIILTMDSWDSLPKLQIAQGKAANCEDNPVLKTISVSKGYREAFPGTGANGEDICFRRTLDPQDPNSPLDITWTRCSSDGECAIP